MNARNVEVNGPGSVFARAFNKSEIKEIEFDPRWSNGTAYFDKATSHPLKPGELAKCRDQHGRRMILIGTRFGTIVVFDRYVGQDEAGVYVINTPKSVVIDQLVDSCGSVGESDMIKLLDGWGILEDNIGNVIEQMAAEFSK